MVFMKTLRNSGNRVNLPRHGEIQPPVYPSTSAPGQRPGIGVLASDHIA